MRRLLNPELALGFLMATILWIGVLGWQASYAPTDSEKRQCEEAAAKPGHKSEECKTLWERTTTDPVAFFTLWLVISTVGLGVSTVMLWCAGEKQLRHARRSAAIQSRDMRDSIAAAESAVLVSRQIGEAQVRAYLSCEGATYTVNGSFISCEMRFRNHGQSPATWSEVTVRAGTFVRGGTGYVRSEKSTGGGPTVAAGQIGKIFVVFLHADMGSGAHESVWERGAKFDVRGQVSWRDVFGKIHTQGFFLDQTPESEPFVPKRERVGEMASYNAASDKN